MVGKVGCFLCIIGSVVIVMNAPAESSAANIQEMQHFVIAPGFLSYAGVIIVSCAFIAFWAGPRYGKKSMLVYLTICSLIGGLSVVATQGLGAAIVAQIGGTPQFNQWFLYVLFVFVITTLVTEIIYLNKALNLFNAALVTPTYYVYFTSSTIITSAILFRGFKGSVTSIITVVMGFFTICAGVVLLQLSKSAKDVPDTAVFAGDLDQVRTIAEQEQPETEPKADAIRGTAAIVRRFSQARQKKEVEEFKRLHEEKLKDLASIGEEEQYEWDGLRRRRTVTLNSTNSIHSRRNTTPFPAFENYPPPQTPRAGSPRIQAPRSPRIHPPLGMSQFPPESDSDEERPSTSVSLFTRAKSIIGPSKSRASTNPQIQSPMHPVPLTEINIPSSQLHAEGSGNAYYGYDSQDTNHRYGLPIGLRDYKTEYEGAGGETDRHIKIVEELRPSSKGSLSVGPTPPPHSARRQFSFQNVFRKGQTNDEENISVPQSRSPMIRKGLSARKGSHSSVVKGATEEERLGLVKGDTKTGRQPVLPAYEDPEEEDEDEENYLPDDKVPMPAPEEKQSPDRGQRRDLTSSATTREEREKELEAGAGSRSPEERYYEQQRRRFEKSAGPGPGTGRPLPPPPPREDDGHGQGQGGAFI